MKNKEPKYTPPSGDIIKFLEKETNGNQPVRNFIEDQIFKSLVQDKPIEDILTQTGISRRPTNILLQIDNPDHHL